MFSLIFSLIVRQKNLAARNLADHLLHPLRAVLPHLRGDMAVHVQRESRRSVTQVFLHRQTAVCGEGEGRGLCCAEYAAPHFLRGFAGRTSVCPTGQTEVCPPNAGQNHPKTCGAQLKPAAPYF